MTAQECLDELERLRKAAVPGPWEAWRYNAAFLGKGGQGIVTRISTRPLDPDDEVIKVADSPDITASDAATSSPRATRAEADRDGARHVFRHSRDAGHGINPR